jgi:hypothetical protein
VDSVEVVQCRARNNDHDPNSRRAKEHTDFISTTLALSPSHVLGFVVIRQQPLGCYECEALPPIAESWSFGDLP